MGFGNFTSDGRSLVGTGNRGPTIWHFDAEPEQAELRAGDEELGAVVFSPDGKNIANGTDKTRPETRTIQLWDCSSEKSRRLVGVSHRCRGSDLQPRRGSLVSGSVDKLAPNLIVWDVSPQTKKATLRGHTVLVNALDFASPPDGDLLVFPDHAGEVRLWSADPQ